AHAWAEIYDSKTQEWLRVDPTPSATLAGASLADGRQVVLPVEAGMGAWVDSLRIQWYRRVVDFDQDDQVKIALSVKEVAQEFLKTASDKAKFWLSVLKETVSEPFSTSSILRVGGVVVCVFALYIVWWSRYGWLNLWHQLRRKPRMLSPLRQQAGRYLAKIKRRSERSGLSDGLNRVRIRLEAIRFGPDVKQSSAKAVFREARRMLRGRYGHRG
ncbi:MAG: hypothetical protein ACPGES_10905, partial [Coraliomargarita sp.]